MRVRTALVNPSKASGVNSIFDRAVERHLAWVVGVGHIYADLEKVARKHDYEVSVLKAGGDEGAEFWVAVRRDLIKSSLEEGSGQVTFESTRAGLGWVTICYADESHAVGDNDLVFYINSDETISTVVEDERIKDLSPDVVPVEYGDYRYTEILYSVKPLKN